MAALYNMRKIPNLFFRLASKTGDFFVVLSEFNRELGVFLGEALGIHFGKIGSEAIEIALKCRHDGGRILINKTTWYAHAHIGALYAGGSQEREKSREYVKILAAKL